MPKLEIAAIEALYFSIVFSTSSLQFMHVTARNLSSIIAGSRDESEFSKDFAREHVERSCGVNVRGGEGGEGGMP